MGLGKTISTIALITTLHTTYWETFSPDNPLIENDSSYNIGPILIVSPATVIN